MNKTVKYLYLICFILLSRAASAQDLGSLISEGNKLYDARDFKAAIEKYQEVIRAAPDNTAIRYKMAFSMYAAGRSGDALSQLQEVVKVSSSAAILSSSYQLMGGIYDKMGSPVKAIESYQKGIKTDSADHSLRYGLGLAYFRNRQYAKAEESARAAIKLKPDHAGSMRLYALVTFHQNKRAPALLALCSFLRIDPAGPQAAEAYTNMQSILKGGVLKEVPGVKIAAPGPETIILNKAITTALAEVGQRKYLVKPYLLAEQLQAVFTAIGKVAEKQKGDPFFRTQLVPFYYKLGQTSHVPAFTSFITRHSDRSAAAWMADHPEQAQQFKDWMGSVKAE